MLIEPTQGLLVAKRYRLERCLGEGGMGAVWAATHIITRKTLALKFLKAPEAHRAALTQRFLREARAACAVEHPNIVQVFDVLELDDGSPVMVMEMLTGESLQQKLDREKRIPLAELVGVMLRVVSAVGSAHAAGVVHRDLKPDNIFLARGVDGTVTVKVLDFGIAKLAIGGEGSASSALLTGTGTMMGTPFYMSPEQVSGEKSIDHGSDIWSLGIILYQCLTGTLPTQGDNLGQIMKLILVGPMPSLAEAAPWLPAEMANLVDRMLSRDRAARPAELREVYGVLERHGLGARASAPGVRFDEVPVAAAAGADHPKAEPILATRPSAPGHATAVVGSTQAPVSRSVPGVPRPVRGLLLAVGAATVALLGASGWWFARDHEPSRAVSVDSIDASAALDVPTAAPPMPRARGARASRFGERCPLRPRRRFPRVTPAAAPGRAPPVASAAKPRAAPVATATPATTAPSKRHEGIH
jgi:tRNA A-37 threonylcarbamoyl transferase component Bud32